MLEIGTTRRGTPVMLTDKERARHIHVLGSIGTGKSKLLEHMIRQDIKAARGLCLLDPHGTLAAGIEKWVAVMGYGRRRVHVIRPGDSAFVPGFNPLRVVPGEALSVRVDAMVGACAQAWGVHDLSETPRLEKILRALFFALAARGLTLAEGPALLRAGDPEGLRRNLTTGLPDPIQQVVWDELNGLPRRDFAEHVESAHTRLSKFLTAPALRLVVGQKEHAIDFRAAMDKSEVVIVNLGARTAFSYENGRVLGTMLINDLFLSALGRDEKVAQRHPFTLYVDEAYDFLSPDVERILDQTRKFGLHAVLAHQRIGQLKERGEGVFSAVMNGTQTKIVLGGLADEDAAIMAREIMRGDIDLEKPKSMTAPVVVGEEPFWLESVSETEGSSESRSYGETASTSEGTNEAAGTSETFDGNPAFATWPINTVASRSLARTTSTTTGTSYAETSATNQSSTKGRAQTLRSIREERPTHFYTLEESLHLAALKLRNLPDRAAIVKRRGKRTVRVETVEVMPLLEAKGAIARFRQANAQKSPYVSALGSVEAEMAARQGRMGEKPAGEGETQFWNEE
jgi:hypothetical protein